MTVVCPDLVGQNSRTAGLHERNESARYSRVKRADGQHAGLFASSSTHDSLQRLARKHIRAGLQQHGCCVPGSADSGKRRRPQRLITTAAEDEFWLPAIEVERAKGVGRQNAKAESAREGGAAAERARECCYTTATTHASKVRPVARHEYLWWRPPRLCCHHLQSGFRPSTQSSCPTQCARRQSSSQGSHPARSHYSEPRICRSICSH